ncbi:hypothetical protein CDCA_CDCA06G1814 [Cyanidium caldarium]|uniref:Uncharacterized protein n=1 Tax=Cyanidium caldarium TaxID=2771 RepID=A0AAV9IUF9_CYACA|nr:hypothetical protein CDCA_CDCA06G1814 [Cyanidium caldarium]
MRVTIKSLIALLLAVTLCTGVAAAVPQPGPVARDAAEVERPLADRITSSSGSRALTTKTFNVTHTLFTWDSVVLNCSRTLVTCEQVEPYIYPVCEEVSTDGCNFEDLNTYARLPATDTTYSFSANALNWGKYYLSCVNATVNCTRSPSSSAAAFQYSKCVGRLNVCILLKQLAGSGHPLHLAAMDPMPSVPEWEAVRRDVPMPLADDGFGHP